MASPEFSVIVPAYNSTRTIDATIASVLRQTVDDFELIVVDDGSTDETPAVLAAHAAADPRIVVVRQENAGTAAARNTGIARARGRLVSFLDHDDLWLPGYLEGMAAALAKAPGAGLAYTDAWLFDEARMAVRRLTSFQHYPGVPPPPPATAQLMRLIEINFIMSSTTIPAEVLARVGGFAPEIQGTDDWDLWLRIVASGRPAVAASEPLLLQRDHPTSQSKDLGLMFANREAVLQRVVDNPSVSPQARELAERVLAQTRRKRALEAARGPIALARRARDARVALRDRLGSRRIWLEQPPAEVRAVFGDLRSLAASPQGTP